MSDRTSGSELRDKRMAEPGAVDTYRAAAIAYELGRAVRELRVERGWSRRELAEAAGMTQSAPAGVASDGRCTRCRSDRYGHIAAPRGIALAGRRRSCNGLARIIARHHSAPVIDIPMAPGVTVTCAQRLAPHPRSATMNTGAETFAPFDPAHYPNTVEDVAAYLEAIIDEYDDDPTANTRALGAVARSRNFSLATVIRVSRALGPRVHCRPSPEPETPGVH